MNDSLQMIQLLLFMAVLVPTVMPFSPSPSLQPSSSCPHRSHLNFNGLYASDNNDNDDDNNLIENEQGEQKAEFGVSYIGGDPCGSKYNNDPFDVQVQKPGMPDDMKARIQALVDKKVAEEKAAADASSQSESY
ncbi:unnamed protein product [Cylindrotheca closterium]|uniref:Uncharacterized protein n=1 Tax=Cylindrotheca closterium TaxID=2856 RepID=A0AAD2G7S7_9STRA|nr:unnamed protein product [Cylindrotheca closterium]